MLALPAPAPATTSRAALTLYVLGQDIPLTRAEVAELALIRPEVYESIPNSGRAVYLFHLLRAKALLNSYGGRIHVTPEEMLVLLEAYEYWHNQTEVDNEGTRRLNAWTRKALVWILDRQDSSSGDHGSRLLGLLVLGYIIEILIVIIIICFYVISF